MIARALGLLVKKPLIPANTYKHAPAAHSYISDRLLFSQNRNFYYISKQGEHTLHSFGTITGSNPTEIIPNYDIVVNKGFKNYVMFCVYAELLAGYLYPFMEKWVTHGLGCMEKGSKQLDDQDFCISIMDLWKYQGTNNPLPPLDACKDYNQSLYRIRMIAGKEELLVNDNFHIDYDLIKEPRDKAPPSLATLMRCIRLFPWEQVITAESNSANLHEYQSLEGLFHCSTDYFRNVSLSSSVIAEAVNMFNQSATFVQAMITYVSNNANNFTINHDTIGRFWFNQDYLFKCLHQFSRLSNGAIEFPLNERTADYLKDFRAASLEKERIVRNLLIHKNSQHYRSLAAKRFKF